MWKFCFQLKIITNLNTHEVITKIVKLSTNTVNILEVSIATCFQNRNQITYMYITPSNILVTKLKLDANLVLRNIENIRKNTFSMWTSRLVNFRGIKLLILVSGEVDICIPPSLYVIEI